MTEFPREDPAASADEAVEPPTEHEEAAEEPEQEEEEEVEPPSKRVRSNPRPRSRASGAAADTSISSSKRGKASGAKGKGGMKRSSGTRPAARSKRGKVAPSSVDEAAAVDDEEEAEEDESVTRCPCNLNEPDDALGFMIQCEACKVWQHGLCVGFSDEANCPDMYFCEKCRPDLHAKRQAKRDAASSRRRSGVEAKAGSEVSDAPSSRARRPSSNEEESSVKIEPTDGMPPPPPRSHHRRRSAADNQSPTLPTAVAALRNPNSAVYPSTSHFAEAKSAKRRSTMNSRDAAFEEQLAATLAVSRADALAAGVDLPASESASLVEEAIEDDEEEEEEPEEPGEPVAPKTQAPRKRSSATFGTSGPNKRRRVEDEGEDSNAGRGRAASQTPSDNGSGSDGGLSNSSAPRVRGGRFGKKPRTAEREALLASRRPARQPNQYSKSRGGRGGSTHGSASPAPPGSPVIASGTESATPLPVPAPVTRKSPTKRKVAASTAHDGPSAPTRKAKASAQPDALAISWGLPDHLSHLGHLLPPAMPAPITLGAPSSNASGSGSRPASPSSSSANGTSNGSASAAVDIIVESAHRVRYPHKRVTMPDMRRRTSVMLDYLGKVATDLDGSRTRARALGMADSDAAQDEIGAVGSPGTDALLNNLQREIAKFNDRFFGVR